MNGCISVAKRDNTGPLSLHTNPNLSVVVLRVWIGVPGRGGVGDVELMVALPACVS